MNYENAVKKFLDMESISILIEIKDKIKAVSKHNFEGGHCNCCEGFSQYDEDLKVIKVVDLLTMEVLFDDEIPEDDPILQKEQDATEYLMSSPANAERLNKAIDNVENGKNIIKRELLEDDGNE